MRLQVDIQYNGYNKLQKVHSILWPSESILFIKITNIHNLVLWIERAVL